MPSGFTLSNHLPEVIAALHAGTAVGVRNAAKKVAQAATDRVPVDIGFLRATVYRVSSDASSYWQATGQAQAIDAFRPLLPEIDLPESDQQAIVAYAAGYALYVHEGTVHMAGRPWLAEALASVNVPEEVAEALRAAIAKASLVP